ncbi:hypothetical protein [Haloparvum sp. AD34]
MVSAFTVVGVLVAVGGAAAVVRDANRVGVTRPYAWAALVFASVASGAVLPTVVPDVPLPGLLVMVVFGPTLYVLERDDSQHGDAPSDPTTLPSQRVDSVEDED